MKRRNEIKEISKELEEMLKMTSEDKRNRRMPDRLRTNRPGELSFSGFEEESASREESEERKCPAEQEESESRKRPVSGEEPEDHSSASEEPEGQRRPASWEESENRKRFASWEESENRKRFASWEESDNRKRPSSWEEPEDRKRPSSWEEQNERRIREKKRLSRKTSETEWEELDVWGEEADREEKAEREEDAGREEKPARKEAAVRESPAECEEPKMQRPKGRSKGRPGAGLIRPSDGLTAAFFVPVIIMLIIFAQRGIFPFGEESFLRTDMYHQYAPFFSEFRHKLTEGGSLLYSWDVGMGVNFSALYAYYLASPFNWLLILCPKPYVIEFMTYLIVLKIGLSGLSFAYYLRKHCRTMDFGVAFFGIFYALSGYMAAYSWNIMWLDCILLFPLIVLGLERLVRKRKCFLYCIALGLSILSNYYISIMICIFMVLYFIALLIMDGKKPVRDFLADIWLFAWYSLLAGGLAAAVLLPEIFALKMTASGDFNFPQTVTSYFSIFDMIARHLPDVTTEIGLDHWPNIYCGVAVLMLFLLYLACRQIKRREKIVYCGLLLIFFASFSLNVLNFIWHGFHYPNSLPARQSFIYIFLMLLICYQAYGHLKETPWKHVVLAFFGSAAFVLLAQKLVTDEAYHFSVFYLGLLFLSAYAGLIGLYKKGTSVTAVLILALGVVSVEAAVNTTVTSVTTINRTNYVGDNEACRALTASIDDPGFYRVQKVDAKTKNDGAWLNFPSVSLFSSTANADLTDFFKNMGCESSTNAYSITGSTPLVDSLFSVKYALYPEQPPVTGLLKPLKTDGYTYLCENLYTLPLGVVIPEELKNTWQPDLINPADVQNNLAKALGADPVLSEVPADTVGTSFTFTAETPGDYYVFVSNKKVEKVSALIGETTRSFDNVNRGYFLEFGWLKSGQEVTLRNDENEQDLVAAAYRFLPEGLKSVYGVLNKNSMELTRKTDTKIMGTVHSDMDGFLYLSIPYDKGWTVLVDGKKEETHKLFDTFLSVNISAGVHTVELRYLPEGLKTGVLLSLGSVALLIIIAGAGAAIRKKRWYESGYDTEKQRRRIR